MKSTIPPTGAHLRISASMLIFRAAFLYFTDSERSDVERLDMRSRLSPRQSKSSMFLTMICWISFTFELN